jgi:tricorn protease
MKLHPTFLTLLLLSPAVAQAQIDARMLRNPAVSETQIAFVYAGDIWLVPKAGGLATRLSSPKGQESFPHFSPDGSLLAFDGNYQGNTDIYVVPTEGGLPVRVTHHPGADRVLDWYPDGRSLLYASSMESGRQRFNQLYRVSKDGGLPEKLPLAYGEFASWSPDGSRLAFTTKAREFGTWKRYRGGLAPDLWIYDTVAGAAKRITDSPANDLQPMWHDRTIYFLSDRGVHERYNLWAYDVDSGETRQVTHFTDDDIHFPGIGPSDLVFEAGGRLYLMNLADETWKEVKVEVVTDRSTLVPQVRKVAKLITGVDISPNGKRAVVGARGEVFTLPAEHGPVLQLTHSSGVAERTPVWSPDGEWIAYFSDRSGEYELTLRASDGSGDETQLTRLGPGFRYTPFWSPDSDKLAFVDQAMGIHYFDRTGGRVVDVGRAKYMLYGGARAFTFGWSPDSRWLAYANDLDNRGHALFIYDTETQTSHQLTSGYYDDRHPVFDPDGKYLYYLTSRTLRPVYSNRDRTWVYPNTTDIAAVPLTATTASPLAPRNDMEEPGKQDGKKDKEEKTDNAKGEEKKGAEEAKPEKAEPVAIDLEGFEERAVVLPPTAGNYSALAAASGKVVYIREPLAGADRKEKGQLLYWDLEDREEKTVLAAVDDMTLAANGEKLLVRKDETLAIIDLKEGQKMEEPLATAGLETVVDPRAEWRQIFDDAWRFERDYFYDPNMHGVDWNAVREHYGKMLDDAVTRWDVNYVIGEMIGEISSSHTYRGGGDQESPERRSVGLLGVDWVIDGGAYRIAKIVDGAPWDAEVRSPLREPGVGVKEGDWVLAVDGVPIEPSKDPWAAFQGLAGKTVILTVNDRPDLQGARRVTVKALAPEEEHRLRYLAWIEANRERVDEATGGRAGYIYVPNTGFEGQTELVRQFDAQFTKQALIVDERFNSGGQIPDRFIELLGRKPLAYWAVRAGKDWQWPPVASVGPKVMLINGWSGSGGDAFPAYFKRAGVGLLIGERTWGGLIGISGSPGLIDGGGVTVPTFRMYYPDGTWFAEGHGVDPDIEVENDPAALARGTDAQLEKGIEVVKEKLAEKHFVPPERPPYERRVPDGG